ncbi:MAG: DUF4340 domain-containing protein, partial [Myxococcales bacterium]|nr:DUF4340 domain-containing protein [Myxococcales bacterium]
MNRTNKILAGALLVQVALVAVTWSMRGRGPSLDAEPLLPDTAVADVQALKVVAKSGEKETTVQFARKGDGWVVPTADDFPADAKKVEEVVKKLVEARIRAPIASNKANHNNLDVGDRDFSRRVTLTVGGKDRTLVVGSAKGSSAHVRFADQDDVFVARGFSAFELRDGLATYVDGDYVKVEAPESVKLTNPRGTVTLNFVEGNWKVAELPPDAPLDTARIEAFVSAARLIRLIEPLGKTVKPEYGFDAADKAVVELKKGDVVTRYTIGALAPDNNRYVKSESNDWVVTTAIHNIGTLLDQTPDRFIKEDLPADGGGPEGGMPPGMPGLPPGMGGPGG